ncbi:MAG: hypothetical protein J6U54_24440 [Clostridiales bacterium]|nr:hypothetical protein [Clostridiales bacterium]
MKSVFAFVLGAAVGAVASYIITSKKDQKKADEQIAAVTAKMSQLKEDNDILRDIRKKAAENYNKPFAPIAQPVAQSEDVPPNMEIDYSAISKKEKTSSVMIKNDDITEITEHEYFNYINNKNYSETTFTFYQGDNTLIDDESGRAVHDPEKYVGASGVDAMSKLTVEETYFVDEMNEVVNCVTIAEDSYYDENTIEEE